MSEGIDPAKTNNSKKFIAFHYWLSNHGFDFQDSVCDGCQDLTILYLDISNTGIITVKNLIVFILFLTLTNLKQFIC